MSEKTQVTPTEAETAVETVNRPESAATRESRRHLVPAVDIHETGEGLVVVADLPGVAPGDADVRVNDGILTIHGRAHSNLPGESVHREFSLLDYHRQFELGEPFDTDKISAELKHGVLTIKLPKAEARKPRQIEVKTV